MSILGVYGLKLTIALTRDGVRGAAALQRALGERSGLGEVRRSIAQTFTPRAGVLKTSNALDRMEQLSFGGGPKTRLPCARCGPASKSSETTIRCIRSPNSTRCATA